MAIEPKVLIGTQSKKKFIANKKFTDRIAYKEVFFENIEDVRKENTKNIEQYHVLNFYGIGGIGKSSLQQELCFEIHENYSDIIYASVDFANIANQSTGRFLLELAKKFEKEHINFCHFGLAYAIYFQKMHKDIVFNSDSHKVINDNLGFIADILSIIEGLGILGIIPGMVNKIYDYSYKKLNLDTDVKKDLKNLELLDISRCEKLLPAFFAYDLKKYMQKNSNQVIVVFLDTYEALLGQNKNNITKFNQDSFVRELISHLPGVLFTICGREFLDWAILDNAWTTHLKQFMIDKLEENDANTFLEHCGIVENDIRKQMLSVSMGHPYHLDILVDTYAEIKNKNILPKAELFANNPREILACFFKYLQAEEIAVINIISIPRFYTYSLFKYLLTHFPTGYPITMFEEFNKFSFVSQIDNNTYHIHEIMRKDLAEIMSSDLFRDINQSIVEYYFSSLEKILMHDEKKTIIKEIIHHLKFFLRDEDYINYLLNNFLDYFTDMQYQGESAYLYDILSDVFSHIEYSQCIEIYKIYTDMIMLNGNFVGAVKNIGTFLSNYTIEEISKEKNLLELYVKKIKHQMVYVSLNETISAVNTIKTFINKEEFPHQYAELIYTEGNMLFEKGDFGECKSFFDEVVEISEQNNFYDLICRTKRKQADCYLMTNDAYNADNYCREGINICEDYGYIRYKNYLECTQAEIYRKLKLFEQAKKMYINCQEKFINLGIEPWIAHTELGLAMIDLEMENYEDVQIHLEYANRIYIEHHHTWGILHIQLLQLQCKYLHLGIIDTVLCDELKWKSKKFGYDYVLKTVEELENNRCCTASLMFL